MPNTHTSQQTRKGSTHIVCRVFGIFSNAINKNLLDAQESEYNKQYEPHQMHAIHYKTTEIQHPLRHNYTFFRNNNPLSLVPRNYRNTGIT